MMIFIDNQYHPVLGESRGYQAEQDRTGKDLDPPRQDNDHEMLCGKYYPPSPSKSWYVHMYREQPGWDP